MAAYKASSRSTRDLVGHRLRHRVGQQAHHLLGRRRHLGPDRVVVAVRLHADRVDHGVRPATVDQVEQRRRDVVHLARVEGLDAEPLGQRAALGHRVDADHPFRTEVFADPGRELPDRSEAEHGQRAPARGVGVHHRLPRRGQDVGQVQELLVGRAVRDLDRAELGLRHAQIFGLAAGHRSVQRRVTEQRRALALGLDLGRLALGEQAALAHPAVPAGDVERDDDPVADGQVGDVRTDFLDDAHGLVPEDVTGLQVRSEHAVQVQVRPADRGRGHLDDHVVGLLDLRVRNLFDPHVRVALPRQSFHVLLLDIALNRSLRQPPNADETSLTR